MALAGIHDAAVVEPQLAVLSPDDSLRASVADIAAEYDVTVSAGGRAGAYLIDPMVGPAAVRALVRDDDTAAPAAVIMRPSAANVVYLALRRSRARLVEDPRVAPDALRSFFADAFAVSSATEERRAYPRAAVSGVTLVAPAGAEIVDLSPYGARLRVPLDWDGGPVVHLRLALTRPGIERDVVGQVAGRRVAGDAVDLRVRFARVDTDVQQELLRIAKADILARTIRDTFRRSEHGDAPGYRRITRGTELVATARALVADRAQLAFSCMHAGRTLNGTAAAFDEGERQLRIEIEDPTALGPAGRYLCYSTSVRHESFLLDGYVLAHHEGAAVLSLPAACAATDQRAQERIPLGLGSPLKVRVGDRAFPVTDLSQRGFSFYVADGQLPLGLDRGGYLEAHVDVGEGAEEREAVLVRHRRAEARGHTIGATFLSDGAHVVDGAFRPSVEESFDGEGVELVPAERVYPAERVAFSSGNREIVGLWCETQHPGPATVVVVPPAWAKTKESTALLAQFLCATFDANGRRVAVLRFDYSNALGESHKDPAFRVAGKETLGLTFSACVEDIRAAISYAHRRIGPAPRSTALIGMSFSGPLCLRAAADDRRVTKLIELMGASDIQDLVRMASGGIDYVAKHRAGLYAHQQNVLGLLSDTDRWSADGIRSRLVFLQDAQADAARLRVPLTWIHGRHDAFVNPDRIRSILETAATVDRRYVAVPCGHIPSKSSEAIVSYVPVARALLDHAGVAEPILAAPSEEQATAAARDEWSRAPRVQLASPRDYWRRYMLGGAEGSLGFDVLAMTNEYQEMMRRQVALLAPEAGETVHDIGGGMGHSVRHLLPAQHGQTSVVFYDLVPQLLAEAARRGRALGAEVQTAEFDVAADEPPASLGSARAVLMSLFLSCLPDPQSALVRLGAALPSGARVVASSIRPDADLSGVYTQLLHEIDEGTVTAPPGYARERFVQEVRDYMNSAAWLLRLADEGTFHFYEGETLVRMFEAAGFRVTAVEHTFGSPQRAVIVRAERV